MKNVISIWKRETVAFLTWMNYGIIAPVTEKMQSCWERMGLWAIKNFFQVHYRLFDKVSFLSLRKDSLPNENEYLTILCPLIAVI